MRYFQQFDMTDCGAACLSMIASYYGKSVSVAEVRSAAGTDTINISLMRLYSQKPPSH